MQVTAIKTPIIEKSQDLFAILKDALDEPLREKEIICVTSKVVALEQGRIVKLSEVKPSAKSRKMKKLKYSSDFDTQPELAELILQEADKLFEAEYIYLALKDNIFIPNAGIDLSNAPGGYAILWPEDSWGWVRDFREKLRSDYKVEELGVVVTDSHCNPLRRGVTGLALAYSGFEGVQSEIGKKDLFGKALRITEKAVADSLATAAILVMGESAECTPFTLIREAPIIFTNREIDPLETFINPKIDLFAGIYSEGFKKKLDIPMKHIPTSDDEK